MTVRRWGPCRFLVSDGEGRGYPRHGALIKHTGASSRGLTAANAVPEPIMVLGRIGLRSGLHSEAARKAVSPAPAIVLGGEHVRREGASGSPLVRRHSRTLAQPSALRRTRPFRASSRTGPPDTRPSRPARTELGLCPAGVPDHPQRV